MRRRYKTKVTAKKSAPSKLSGRSLKESLAIDVYKESVPMEELLKIRKQLAKSMNQRMVRLERASSKITGESFALMEAGAYSEAQAILKGKGKVSKNGKPLRFSEKLEAPGMDRWAIRREITQLQGLMGMASSSVAELHKLEKQRYQHFKNMGLSDKTISNPDFYKFINSYTYKDLMKLYNSDEIFELFDKTYSKGKSASQIESMFDEWLKKEQIGKSLKELIKYLGMTKI